MNIENFQWVISTLILLPLWKMYDIMGKNDEAVRKICKDLYDRLHAHEDVDSKFHLDIVQNVIPGAMRDLAARMDARFDRLEDKIERRDK